ncbi:MAG TPA: hypothetical protein VGH19_08595 [Verrucomicrobiae bacterium]
MRHHLTFKIKLFPAQVTLDGEVVALPVEERKSLRSIKCALEGMALQRERVLISMVVDGVPVSLQSTLKEKIDFRFVAGRTVSIDFLGLELLVAARRQVLDLIDRSRLNALQVLINPPTISRKLWQEMQPDLREPLLTLSFMPEIGLASVEGLPVMAPSLTALAEDLLALSRRMELLICEEQDVYVLSEGFELIVCWLENLQEAIMRARNSLYAVSFD